MPRRFVTETVEEKVPILFCGEQTQFSRALIHEIHESEPEFFGVSFDEYKRSGQNATPYLCVAVIEKDRAYEEVKEEISRVQKRWGSRIVIILSSYISQRAQKHIIEDFSQSFVVVVSLEDLSSTYIQQCTRAILLGRKKNGVEEIVSKKKQQLPAPKLKEEKDIPSTKTQEVVRLKPRLFSHLPTEHEITPRQKMHAQQPHFSGQNPQSILRAPLAIPKIEQQEKITKKKTEEEGDVLAKLFTEVKQERKEQQPPLEQIPTRDDVHKKRPQIQSPRFEGGSRLALGMGIGVLLLGGIGGGVFGMYTYAKNRLTQGVVELSQSFLTQYDQSSLSRMQKNLDLWSAVTQTTAKGIRPLGSLLSDSSFVNQSLSKTDLFLAILEKERSAFLALQAFLESSSLSYAQIVSPSGEESIPSMKKALQDVLFAEKEFSLLSAELSKIRRDSERWGSGAQVFLALQKNITVLRKNLLLTEHILPILPQLLGEDRKKTYVVLLQNPLELRPSGGFIASYAILTFEKGKLLDIQVQDSYAADSQLRGRVEPPADLKKYLQESQWFFRDSNWNAQFPKAASQAEWFVSKELGIVPDGTIAMNAYTLQKLLSITGELRIKEYDNEIVSAETFIERLQKHSELSGGTTTIKKKEYMTAVAEAVFAGLQALPKKGVSQFGTTLLDAAESGQLLIHMKDDSLNQTFQLLGWGGEVKTPMCPQQFSKQACFVDSLYQVDTNVGVNRANYYVRRSATHSVVLSNTAAAHTYTMRMTNNAASPAWPAGTYKDYVRFYIPDFAQVMSVSVNNVIISPKDMMQTQEGNKKILGVYVEVGVGQTSTIVVNYTTQFAADGVFSYALFTQRQPGADEYPLSLSFRVQKPLKLSTITSDASVTGDGLAQFDVVMDGHQYMAVEVSPEE